MKKEGEDVLQVPELKPLERTMQAVPLKTREDHSGAGRSGLREAAG